MVNEGLKAFLEKCNELIRRQNEEGITPNPELARKALSALSSYVGEAPGSVEIKDRLIRSDGSLIPVRIYHSFPEKKLPVMLFIHGGGHMCGSIETYDVICRKMSFHSPCIIVSVEYRLAPEHPYPSGLDDCRHILKCMPEVLEGVNADMDSLFLCGDSGGGTFAATLAAEEDGPFISGLILIYASLDYTMSSESYANFSKGYFLETDRIAWYFENYFIEGCDRIKASPLFMSSMNLPSTLIISAGFDPLLGDSEKYRDKLLSQGISVEYIEFKDMIHAFLFLERLVPEVTSDVYYRIGNFLASNIK